MVDSRKNVKVSSGVKKRLEQDKRRFTLKTESEYIAYLIMVETWAFSKMPTEVYFEALKKAKELDAQQVF